MSQSPWLSTTLRLLASESSKNQPGGDLLIDRLMDMIFIQIVRAFITQSNDCSESPSWFKALSDKSLGQALRVIHEKPEVAWTVASLADHVSMSRTTFATKFASLVGQSPMAYLTTYRMQQAITLLKNTEDNVVDIAQRVGYTSEPAFAKAFKRECGKPPGAFRQPVVFRQRGSQ